MSFTIAAPTPSASEPPISSGTFWPVIDPGVVRKEQRIDAGITPERLRSALVHAIADVNATLNDWRLERLAEGRSTLEAVPAADVDNESVLVARYRRAVGCIAKAMLMERLRDIDTSAQGDRKADALADPIDDHWRDARWAIADILGKRRTVVELI